MYGCGAAIRREGVLTPDPEFCGPQGPARRQGTNNVGDVLIYDSRILHWGGANTMKEKNDFRDVVSLSFVHPWWVDRSRPLTKEGKVEAAKWRKWQQGSGSGPIDEVKPYRPRPRSRAPPASAAGNRRAGDVGDAKKTKAYAAVTAKRRSHGRTPAGPTTQQEL